MGIVDFRGLKYSILVIILFIFLFYKSNKKMWAQFKWKRYSLLLIKPFLRVEMSQTMKNKLWQKSKSLIFESACASPPLSLNPPEQLHQEPSVTAPVLKDCMWSQQRNLPLGPPLASPPHRPSIPFLDHAGGHDEWFIPPAKTADSSLHSSSIFPKWAEAKWLYQQPCLLSSYSYLLLPHMQNKENEHQNLWLHFEKKL